MDNDCKAVLDDLIKQRKALWEVHDILLSFKISGIQPDEISNYWGELRDNADTETDDWILEILDVVCGWCKPEYRVW
jgi:hypothetical protein